MRRSHAASVVWLAGALLLSLSRVAAAQSQGLAACAQGSRPVLAGGYNDVLRFWAEGGIWCGVDAGGSVVVGLRYAESRANILPWVSLSYSWPLREGLSLTMSAGLRERLGDWEGDRLPEATLRFSLPSGMAVGGSFDVAAGLFNVYGAQSGVVRAGARVNLSSRPVPLGSLSAWLTAAAGHYTYGTGDGHTFLTWTANLRVPVTEGVSFQLAYVQADSSGPSPLRFDLVAPDRYWTGHFQGTAPPAVSWRAGVLVDSMAGRGIREYQFGVGSYSNWLNVTYRTTDHRLLLHLTISQ